MPVLFFDVEYWEDVTNMRTASNKLDTFCISTLTFPQVVLIFLHILVLLKIITIHQITTYIYLCMVTAVVGATFLPHIGNNITAALYMQCHLQ